MNSMQFVSDQEVAQKVAGYANAKCFLKVLKQNYRKLSPQQVSTLRGQAVSGDVDGAYRGLEKLIRRA